MKARAKFAPVKVDVPVVTKNESFVLTQNGTFKAGAYVIRKEGMQGTGSEDVQGLGEVISLEILDDDVGSGACSTVKKALDKEHNRVVALKVVNVLEKDRRHQLMNELATLTQGTSPYLVSFYGAFFQEGMIHIALEYMDGGALSDAVSLMGPIPEDVLGFMTVPALKGLHFLHEECRRIHRDIKPSNILLTKNGVAKISDFGISRFLANDDQAITFVGTTNYMSPERLDGNAYSFGSDVWSLGLSIMECLQGAFPYPAAKGYFDLLNTIVNEPVPSLKPGTACSKDLSDFLDRCLQKDPTKRASASQLLGHAFAKKNADNKAAMALWMQQLMKKQKKKK